MWLTVSSTAFGAWTVSGADTIDARSGFSVAIPCNPPPANPSPIVFWQRSSTNITAGNPLAGGADDRVQVLPSGHLVIHQLQASDFSASPYRCFASNANTHTISMSPQTFTLNEGTVCTMYISMFLMCVVCSFNHCAQGTPSL